MLERVAFSLNVLCEQVSDRFLSAYGYEGMLSEGELGLEELLQRRKVRLAEDVGASLGMQLLDLHS
ncbi:hypothetical protein [Nocardia salmonicida]|uniref:hypothetical protein n=1 Tax=Nocardia salmonicida TaxID=53431 RepID=UPI00365ED466